MGRQLHALRSRVPRSGRKRPSISGLQLEVARVVVTALTGRVCGVIRVKRNAAVARRDRVVRATKSGGVDGAGIGRRSAQRHGDEEADYLRDFRKSTHAFGPFDSRGDRRHTNTQPPITTVLLR